MLTDTGFIRACLSLIGCKAYPIMSYTRPGAWCWGVECGDECYEVGELGYYDGEEGCRRAVEWAVKDIEKMCGLK